MYLPLNQHLLRIFYKLNFELTLLKLLYFHCISANKTIIECANFTSASHSLFSATEVATTIDFTADYIRTSWKTFRLNGWRKALNGLKSSEVEAMKIIVLIEGRHHDFCRKWTCKN